MTNYSKLREEMMRESVLTHFGSWAINTYDSSQNTKFKNVVDKIVHTYGKLAEANTNQTQIEVTLEDKSKVKYPVTDYKIMAGLGLTELINFGKVFTTSQMEHFNETCFKKSSKAFSWVDNSKVVTPAELDNSYELLKQFQISVGATAAVDKANYRFLELSYIAQLKVGSTGIKDDTDYSLLIGEGDKSSKAVISYLGIHTTTLEMSNFFEVSERVLDKDSIVLALSSNK